MTAAPGGNVAGKQGYSGVRPPSDGKPSRTPARRERLVRMAPPANDNRGQGISLGRLRFTGLRLLGCAVVAGLLLLAAWGAGLV